MTKQVCHRLDLILEYFDTISGTDFRANKCMSQCLLVTIINNRHSILHNGGKNNKGERIDLKLSDVNNAIEIARRFINEVEARFVNIGKERIIIDPTEE